MSENNIYQNQLNDINYSIDNNSKSKEITDTIINFNVEELNKTSIKKTENSIRQFNISPIVKRTPNTKADIIIQKIYTNRKNIIKNYQNTLTNFRYNHGDSSNILSSKNNGLNNDNLYSYENRNNNLIVSYRTPIIVDEKNSMLDNKNIDIQIPIENNQNENISDSPSIKNTNIKDSSDSSNKSVTPLSEESVSSNLWNKHYRRENIFDKNNEKRKRRYYRTIKIKKDKNEIIKPINVNEIETHKSSPFCSPRDITQDLWNDLVENYYIEFQKLCKDEAQKYKYLSHYNDSISNLLKLILLISGCFTFTLSISIPNSLFMSTTTIISSCLTAIITSLSGFFQFEKKSEIQYNIYRELDKLYNIISLEMLKPTYMRTDPYEYILTLRNRRDELLKTLQKK